MLMIRRLLIVLILPFAMAVARAEEPQAMKGVALVIGQSKYEHLSPLPNPANDAREIAKLLTDLGFEVDQVSDGDGKKLARALRRFTEDADGADVAALYYSGHGIEAGGENWLVPVDADLDALGDASKKLVPISDILNELKATVPIAVILLDACRSNPFPAGTLLKSDEKPEGALPGSGGLSVPRGFAAVGGETTQSLGTIIGFAAEPGLPALDGEAGGNSPYAAALIRHLSAMNGEEFGLVMRMVTEEVYLKTKAQQRPWVNESLRRQLYFGLAVDEPKGDDGLITGERRKLLLTIAALGASERAQVERIAKSDAIPMDALYGVLRALGEENIPRDAALLEQVLFAQSARIKEMLKERKSLDSNDPDILRLVSAADKALDEGAIKAARMFLDQAKLKVAATKTDIEDIEKLVRDKRISNAALLEKSADAAALEFDYQAQARDYADAFAWVKDTDKLLAWRYKNREADAWQDHGDISGDNGSFERALKTYEAALSIIKRTEFPLQWSKSQNNLANTLQLMGARETGTEKMEAAIAAYRLALQELTKKRDPEAWALLQNNLGVALADYGARANKPSALSQAEFAYDLALDVRTRETDPKAWAETQVNLGSLYLTKATREKSRPALEKAIAFLKAALEVLTRKESVAGWASAQNNLGLAYRRIGELDGDMAALKQSVAVYEDIITAFPRETFPVDWGLSVNNLGIALISVGEKEPGVETLHLAVMRFGEALQVLTFERSPTNWAKVRAMTALAWNSIGMKSPGVEAFEQSALISAELIARFPIETAGDQWASASLQYGFTRMMLGTRRQGMGDFEAARDALAGAVKYFKSVNNLIFAEQAQAGLDMVLRLLPPQP